MRSSALACLSLLFAHGFALSTGLNNVDSALHLLYARNTNPVDIPQCKAACQPYVAEYTASSCKNAADTNFECTCPRANTFIKNYKACAECGLRLDPDARRRVLDQGLVDSLASVCQNRGFGVRSVSILLPNETSSASALARPYAPLGLAVGGAVYLLMA